MGGPRDEYVYGKKVPAAGYWTFSEFARDFNVPISEVRQFLTRSPNLTRWVKAPEEILENYKKQREAQRHLQPNAFHPLEGSEWRKHMNAKPEAPPKPPGYHNTLKGAVRTQLGGMVDLAGGFVGGMAGDVAGARDAVSQMVIDPVQEMGRTYLEGAKQAVAGLLRDIPMEGRTHPDQRMWSPDFGAVVEGAQKASQAVPQAVNLAMQPLNRMVRSYNEVQGEQDPTQASSAGPLGAMMRQVPGMSGLAPFAPAISGAWNRLPGTMAAMEDMPGGSGYLEAQEAVDPMTDWVKQNMLGMDPGETNEGMKALGNITGGILGPNLAAKPVKMAKGGMKALQVMRALDTAGIKLKGKAMVQLLDAIVPKAQRVSKWKDTVPSTRDISRLINIFRNTDLRPETRAEAIAELNDIGKTGHWLPQDTFEAWAERTGFPIDNQPNFMERAIAALTSKEAQRGEIKPGLLLAGLDGNRLNKTPQQQGLLGLAEQQLAAEQAMQSRKGAGQALYELSKRQRRDANMASNVVREDAYRALPDTLPSGQKRPPLPEPSRQYPDPVRVEAEPGWQSIDSPQNRGVAFQGGRTMEPTPVRPRSQEFVVGTSKRIDEIEEELARGREIYWKLRDEGKLTPESPEHEKFMTMYKRLESEANRLTNSLGTKAGGEAGMTPVDVQSLSDSDLRTYALDLMKDGGLTDAATRDELRIVLQEADDRREAFLIGARGRAEKRRKTQTIDEWVDEQKKYVKGNRILREERRAKILGELKPGEWRSDKLSKGMDPLEDDTFWGKIERELDSADDADVNQRLREEQYSEYSNARGYGPDRDEAIDDIGMAADPTEANELDGYRVKRDKQAETMSSATESRGIGYIVKRPKRDANGNLVTDSEGRQIWEPVLRRYARGPDGRLRFASSKPATVRMPEGETTIGARTLSYIDPETGKRVEYDQIDAENAGLERWADLLSKKGEDVAYYPDDRNVDLHVPEGTPFTEYGGPIQRTGVPMERGPRNVGGLKGIDRAIATREAEIAASRTPRQEAALARAQGIANRASNEFGENFVADEAYFNGQLEEIEKAIDFNLQKRAEAEDAGDFRKALLYEEEQDVLLRELERLKDEWEVFQQRTGPVTKQDVVRFSNDARRVQAGLEERIAERMRLAQFKIMSKDWGSEAAPLGREISRAVDDVKLLRDRQDEISTFADMARDAEELEESARDISEARRIGLAYKRRAAEYVDTMGEKLSSRRRVDAQVELARLKRLREKMLTRGDLGALRADTVEILDKAHQLEPEFAKNQFLSAIENASIAERGKEVGRMVAYAERAEMLGNVRMRRMEAMLADAEEAGNTALVDKLNANIAKLRADVDGIVSRTKAIAERNGVQTRFQDDPRGWVASGEEKIGADDFGIRVHPAVRKPGEGPHPPGTEGSFTPGRAYPEPNPPARDPGYQPTGEIYDATENARSSRIELTGNRKEVEGESLFTETERIQARELAKAEARWRAKAKQAGAARIPKKGLPPELEKRLAVERMILEEHDARLRQIDEAIAAAEQSGDSAKLKLAKRARKAEESGIKETKASIKRLEKEAGVARKKATGRIIAESDPSVAKPMTKEPTWEEQFLRENGRRPSQEDFEAKLAPMVREWLDHHRSYPDQDGYKWMLRKISGENRLDERAEALYRAAVKRGDAWRMVDEVRARVEFENEAYLAAEQAKSAPEPEAVPSPLPPSKRKRTRGAQQEAAPAPESPAEAILDPEPTVTLPPAKPKRTRAGKQAAAPAPPPPEPVPPRRPSMADNPPKFDPSDIDSDLEALRQSGRSLDERLGRLRDDVESGRVGERGPAPEVEPVGPKSDPFSYPDEAPKTQQEMDQEWDRRYADMKARFNQLPRKEREDRDVIARWRQYKQDLYDEIYKGRRSGRSEASFAPGDAPEPTGGRHFPEEPGNRVPLPPRKPGAIDRFAKTRLGGRIVEGVKDALPSVVRFGKQTLHDKDIREVGRYMKDHTVETPLDRVRAMIGEFNEGEVPEELLNEVKRLEDIERGAIPNEFVGGTAKRKDALIPRLARLLVPQTAELENMGGFGKVMARKLADILMDHDGKYNKAMLTVREFGALSQDRANKIVHALETWNPPANHQGSWNPVEGLESDEREIAYKLHEMLQEIGQERVNAGLLDHIQGQWIPTRIRENYFPHEYIDKLPVHEESWHKNMPGAMGSGVRTGGARQDVHPAATLTAYLDRQYKLLALNKHLGFDGSPMKNREQLMKIYAAAKRIHGEVDANTLMMTVKRALGDVAQPSDTRRAAWQGARSIQVAEKMFTAWLQNLSGIRNTIGEFGSRHAAAALWKKIRGDENAQVAMRATQKFYNDDLEYYLDGVMPGTSLVSDALNKFASGALVMHRKTEGFLRTHSSLAGKLFVDDALRQLANPKLSPKKRLALHNRLKDLRVSQKSIDAGQLLGDDKYNVMWRSAYLTQFGSKGQDIPFLMDATPELKTFTQFMGWMTKQAQFEKRLIMRSISEGDPKPLLSFLLASGLTGEAYQEARDAIKNVDGPGPSIFKDPKTGHRWNELEEMKNDFAAVLDDDVKWTWFAKKWGAAASYRFASNLVAVGTAGLLTQFWHNGPQLPAGALMRDIGPGGAAYKLFSDDEYERKRARRAMVPLVGWYEGLAKRAQGVPGWEPEEKGWETIFSGGPDYAGMETDREYRRRRRNGKIAPPKMNTAERSFNSEKYKLNGDIEKVLRGY